MKGWVRFRRGSARYTGVIGKWPFVAWLATPEGRAVLDAAVARTRFAVLAERRAKGRLWRHLAAAAREPAAVVTIQSEADAYLDRLREFTYAAGLPRLSVDLHRVVVVPRVLVNGAAYGAIARRLLGVQAFASLEGGDVLRDFFVRTLVDHLDTAIAATLPSPKRPLTVGRDWISVGVDGAFEWRLPMPNEPQWDGHHYVVELTRDPITRAVRKKVVAAVERIGASLPSLSRVERNEILRRAVHGA
jgi:ribosomal protein L34